MVEGDIIILVLQGTILEKNNKAGADKPNSVRGKTSMKAITLMRFTREKTIREQIDLHLLNVEFLSYLTLLRMGFVSS